MMGRHNASQGAVSTSGQLPASATGTVKRETAYLAAGGCKRWFDDFKPPPPQKGGKNVLPSVVNSIRHTICYREITSRYILLIENAR